jgi:predicted GIY-YIG superfamily endonuclease
MTVYLIHFDRPYKHSRHYLGYAEDLDARIERHHAGNGARLMEVVTNAGITWRLARTWEGDRKFERWLKRKKGASWFCPLCAGPIALNRAKERPQ